MSALYPSYAHKMSVIQNPVSENYFAPLESMDDGYILNFGRQIPLKMAAMLDAARDMPGTRFVFVGTGEMVREHGLTNVDFVGFSAEVIRYIDRAAACVFPSKSENFPLVGLEAMARGKPVIATKRGFSEYIIHMKNGYLLESADASAVTEAISNVIGNPKLAAALGREGRRTAEEFRPAKIISQYEELYRRAQPRASVQ
jgi:glycosyltransferase involved in cell wall biosynthesis